MEVLDALLAAGADIAASGAVIGGGTPLDDAVAFGQWRTAQRLVERGARTTLWHAAALDLMPRLEECVAGTALPTPEEVTNAYPSSSSAVPAVFGGAGARRLPASSVALVAPFAALEAHTYSAPMLWQGVARLRCRMPEGYAFVPTPSGDASMRPWPSTTQTVMLGIQMGKRSPDLTATLRARIARDLHDWQVRTVIVGPMDHQGEMLRVFRFLLRREPRTSVMSTCGGVCEVRVSQKRRWTAGDPLMSAGRRNADGSTLPPSYRPSLHL